MMRRTHLCAIGMLLVASLCHGVPDAAAQEDPYPAMAPIDAYLMDRDAEIQLARSAAPDSLSRDATVLVLGRHGYETAVEGTNGFVCLVARSWIAAFDWPEFWNPKIRAADCMNRQAARSLVPVIVLRSEVAMAGRSKEDMLAAIRAAYEQGDVPALAYGAMDYMMSKSAYLTDMGDHNAPHLMFFTMGLESADWGSGVANSPVMAAPYWFFWPQDTAQLDGLPPINVFLVGVPTWSDGAPAGGQDH
ncbi:MAG: hypothetical protein R2834_19325 [Rhodothermales bacterium]